MNEMQPDFVLAVLGQQTLELAALRLKVAQLEAAAKAKAEPTDNVVPLKEPA